MTHKCSNCRFKDECTEQEKRLTGKGEFCYDFEEKYEDEHCKYYTKKEVEDVLSRD